MRASAPGKEMDMSITRTVALGAIAAVLAATPASAALNLVTNGSFESGLAGWTLANPPPSFSAVAITYGAASPYPTGAFGEAVPANNAPTNSPDAVGTRAAYFVSDFSRSETLSQQVFLTAGIYQIGFSAYAPANGYANAGDAQFQGIVANVTLANYAVSVGPSTTWQTFAGAANITTDGLYTVAFSFSTNLAPSKDIVVDQVYIIAGNPPIGVPEPATLALFGASLLGLGAARRARRRG
jgi:hypothetical protein